MKKYAQLFVCVCVSLLGSSCSAGETVADNFFDTGGTSTVGQVSLQVLLASTNYIGTNIMCEICWTNGSNQEIGYSYETYYRVFNVEIKNARGVAIPLTSFGEAEMGGAKNVCKLRSSMRLSPKESLVQRYDLAKLFKLTIPGVYTMTVSRENVVVDSAVVVLKVEKISFTVLKKRAR